MAMDNFNFKATSHSHGHHVLVRGMQEDYLVIATSLHSNRILAFIRSNRELLLPEQESLFTSGTSTR